MNTPVGELAATLPPGTLLTAEASLQAYRRDQAAWAPGGVPAAVVRADTAEQVREAVRWAIRHRVPVVPRGAGTGLAGAANAVDGCLVVSFERMTAISKIDPLERLAVVHPGVLNDAVRAEAAGHGLWYPPDPVSSASCTIGGNVATNAGGICCVKYGVTGDYVLSLQLVTGTGDLVRIGRRTAKGVTGYDLTSLIVGSEGTLGLVTEVTLRLRPLPPPATTVVGFFDSVEAAGLAVRGVAAAGVIPSALELMDSAALVAVDEWTNMGLSEQGDTLLLARVDTPDRAGATEAAAVHAAFDTAGATWSAVTDDPAEGDDLFSARRLAYPALERLGPVLTEDICVPLAQLPTMLNRIRAIAETRGVPIATVGHAGDGNLHPLVRLPATDLAADPAAAGPAHLAFDDVMTAALDLGGTITGEHGVGLLKRGGLAREVDPVVRAMFARVKDALDPHGLLNPGKAW